MEVKSAPPYQSGLLGEKSPNGGYSFAFFRSLTPQAVRTLLAFRISYLALFLLGTTLESSVLNPTPSARADVYLYFYLPIGVAFAWCAICAALSRARIFQQLWIHLATDVVSLGWAVHVTQFAAQNLSFGYLTGVIVLSLVAAWGLSKLEASRATVAVHAKEAEELRLREQELAAELQRVHSRLADHERVTRLMSDEHKLLPSASKELGELIGQSPVIQRIFSLVERVGTSDATVLVTGESGTGKELIARALHRLSNRRDKPFVAVNCGAIPSELLESELFGHKKGSFTGATTDTIGMFRQAHGGTIFLDEVGELPMAMQVKLLRSLQERTVRPVGASTDIPIDVRVLAATNRTLRSEVAAGKFREDLFFRLNVINIHLPPLRDRTGDIEILIAAFVRKKSTGPTAISPEAMELLKRYPYPGNVRELENIIERALVLGGGSITPEHLPESVLRGEGALDMASPGQGTYASTQIVERDISFPLSLDELLADAERRIIRLAIEKNGGNRKLASEALGINLRSLRYRAEKLGL